VAKEGVIVVSGIDRFSEPPVSSFDKWYGAPPFRLAVAVV
jgi:hypothetical protein